MTEANQEKNYRKRAHEDADEEDNTSSKLAKQTEGKTPTNANTEHFLDSSNKTLPTSSEKTLPSYLTLSYVCNQCNSIDDLLTKILKKAGYLHASSVFRPYVRGIEKHLKQLREGPITEEEYSADSDNK